MQLAEGDEAFIEVAASSASTHHPSRSASRRACAAVALQADLSQLDGVRELTQELRITTRSKPATH